MIWCMVLGIIWVTSYLYWRAVDEALDDMVRRVRRSHGLYVDEVNHGIHHRSIISSWVRHFGLARDGSGQRAAIQQGPTWGFEEVCA